MSSNNIQLIIVMAQPVFKEYDRTQATFLPPALEELIAPTHMVRFVDHVIDQMELEPILATYPGGGTSSYHPRMMLKVLIYGYVERIHSCRAIAKAVRERIPFMWLAAGQRPDFRTINNFRKQRLPDGGLKGVFRQVIQMLVELGLVDLSAYTVDGTTLEANARRGSAVWRKNSQRYQQSAIKRIEEYFDQIQRLADLEEAEWAGRQAPEEASEPAWTAEQVAEVAAQVDQALTRRELQRSADPEETDSEAGDPDPPTRGDLKKARTRLRRITETELPKLSKYEGQLRLLGDRNSYSSTDPDATFMRMKDQSPFDKLLAAGYNLQMGAQNQYVLGYSLHSNAADKVNLAEHLAGLSFTPQWVCADGGYGSLYNFEMLDEAGITGIIKAPDNHRRPKPYSRYAMDYEPDQDQYRCPQDRPMPLKQTRDYSYGPNGQRTTQTRVYECVDCSGCPVRTNCTYGEGNRSIRFIPALEDWKRRMAERMSRGKGKTLSRNRGSEIESVFGLLKENDGMRRLVMRGKKMAELEVGLKSMAHNLRKMRSDLLDKLTAHLLAAMGLQPA
jgi:transposase